MHLIQADQVVIPDRAPADTILIDSGSVVAVGMADELRSRADRIEALPGVVVPGRRDAHFHPVTYAASLVVPALK